MKRQPMKRRKSLRIPSAVTANKTMRVDVAGLEGDVLIAVELGTEILISRNQARLLRDWLTDYLLVHS